MPAATDLRDNTARELRHALREHGCTLAGALGLPRATGAELADTLLMQYSRWPRRYHDGRHLLACVRAADAVRALAPAPDAVAFALWFHDAVYWPWRHDNEARSAVQASAAALRLGLGDAFARQVNALVMATAHLAGGDDAAAPGADPAAAWVQDIDLGILGASPDVYDRYERDVRREYFFVMPWTWRKGRAAVLRHFIEQPQIYRTPHFRARLEQPARANLQRALLALHD
jgi:predicted metal-dependent HD superfamily phosphohydrolase